MITINLTKKTVLLVCVILLSIYTKADDSNPLGVTADMLLPKFQKTTPEAASLGRYGTFNMSEYSGSPNIKIPLHTINAGNISIPLELYYEASGIKVGQDATFVGLGWNLSYGGHISHIVCGEDDFKEAGILDPDKFNKLFNNNVESVPNDVSVQYWKQFPVYFGLSFSSSNHITNGLSEFKDPIQNYRNVIPAEISRGRMIPDIFQANFCGQSVSFVIDKRGTQENGKYPIVILNDNPNKYKISYEKGNYPHPKTILITDDKGINYEFTAYKEYDCTDSYYLTKVYGADGVSGKSCIEYEYNRHLQSVGTEWHKNLYSYTAKIKKADCPIPSPVKSYLENIMADVDKTVPTTIDPGCFKYYPSKIKTPLEIIEFTLDSTRKDIKNAYAIKDIVIKSRQGGNTLNQIHFKYGYFKEKQLPKGENEFTGFRLRLDVVNINDQQYQLDYDNSILPNLNSKEKDYWGYYNGVNNTTLSVSPKYKLNSQNKVVLVEYLGEANRYASETNCKVGMLKKITYPTGGYTVFEFEANRFNDEYYYPDASHNISFPSATKSISVHINGTKTESQKFIPNQGNIKLKIDGLLEGSSDYFIITVKNNSGSQVWNKKYEKTKYFGETVSLSLTKGETYIMEAKLNGSSSSGANCEYIYEDTDVTASPTTKDENGGYSIGGGMRIKSIMNYDAPQKGKTTGELINRTDYEYNGGKLLIPTVRLETHYVKYQPVVPINGQGTLGTTIDISFQDVSSESSYMYICSLGVPATVGYSTVTKKEYDTNGNVMRKHILHYHNYAYEINGGIREFYYNSQGYLNGKIKDDALYSGANKMIHSTSYIYNNKRQGSLLFPKSTPQFFDGCGVGVFDGVYNVTMYRSFNIWTYLTQKTETFYDKNGNKTTSNTTSFLYNPTNYQISQQTVNNGVDSVRTSYCYSSDKKITGYSHLVNKHNLSELMGVETYHNGTFAGGNKYSYATDKNPKSNLEFPVVSQCYSVIPNASKSSILEMTVTSYDGYGNIREYKKKNGTPVTIIWSYNHQFPIMEIVGCTYKDACKVATNIPTVETQTNVSDNTIASIHSKLKAGLKDAYVTAYIYSPWHTVKRIIKPNGYAVNYGYDSYGRLTETKDASGILQKYSYNYKNK